MFARGQNVADGQVRLALMALKQDEDFVRFLTIGAVGTAAVLDAFDKRHGHRAIELERYATANKLWRTKLKRLRVPDILCLDCGVRVEVRAKSKLAIRMSHGEKPGREWDAGLRDTDLAAFVAWREDSETVSDHHHFFQIAAMRSALPYARKGSRKAASEGAERDISWPASVPKRDGLVASIDAANGAVRYEPVSGRAHTYRLSSGTPAHVYVTEGQVLTGGEQFLLGSVAAADTIECPGRTWNFAGDLSATDKIDRYIAVKAAGIDGCTQADIDRLAEIAEDSHEDERIRLEAMGSLARLAPKRYTKALIDRARQETDGKRGATEFAMESVFILSELNSVEAAGGLLETARDLRVDPETRCAAVWGLGTAGIDDSEKVIPFLCDPDDDVTLHALAGIGEIDQKGFKVLRQMLESGNDRQAATAGELLAQEGESGISLLLQIANRNDHAGLWARVALGESSEEEVREAAGGMLRPELLKVLSPMWAWQASWLNRETTNPVDVLRQQRVRHLG